jgi:toxin ParE1/3/4
VRVRFTRSARREFLEALAFIRTERPAAAEALAARAAVGLAQLRDFPESGRVVPEFPNLVYREVLVSPYRFFYRVADDTVWIVGVWHDRQLPESPGA